MEKPRLSITIPTANRPQCVARLLKRLEAEIASNGIDSRAVEVCMFNNGGNPDTAAEMAAARLRIPNFKAGASDEILPLGDSFASAIRLATAIYHWGMGDDDLPLRNSLPAMLRELAEAERNGYPLLQLQQHSCDGIDAEVEKLEAKCESELISPGTDLLTPHAFHWLGQMSCTVLHRRFFDPGSLFAARRTDEIVPLLRAVVDGLRAGPVLCIKGHLLARTVDAGNWQGMMAFAHAIEFPRYWNYLREGRDGLVCPFKIGFLSQMIFRAAMLRDVAPGLYRAMQQVPSAGLRHSLVRLLVSFIQPKAVRRMMVNRALARNPGQARALLRLREWNARI